MYTLVVIMLVGSPWEQSFATQRGCELAQEVVKKDPDVAEAVCMEKVDRQDK